MEIVWHSYQLDPGAPTTPVETATTRPGPQVRRSARRGQEMIDRVEAVAAEEGMVSGARTTLRVDTMDAHRLLHLALHERWQRSSRAG